MQVKICGITQPDQARAIAQMGATALGFICAPVSPRYVSPQQIRAIVEALLQEADGAPIPDRIGVFVDANLDEIVETAAIAHLTGIQLHGSESPAFCDQVRDRLPTLRLIKAIRLRPSTATPSPWADGLAQMQAYAPAIDWLLLDAYHPQQHGGTGLSLDWASLRNTQFPCPWFLAGGLTPDNIATALSLVTPSGIDLSSGVERAPGDKDLPRVASLFERLQAHHRQMAKGRSPLSDTKLM